MQFWNEVLHTALIGSDKRSVATALLPPALSELAENITAEAADKEDRFLRIAALAFNYRQAGATPLSKEGLTLPAAPPEERSYCSNAAMQVLYDLLLENNVMLTRFWLQLCSNRGLLVRPDLLPALLKAAAGDKTLRETAGLCGGKRAEWLAGLNTEWSFLAGAGDPEEERWQTGSLDQRRLVLQQVRNSQPDKGLGWLEQTWPREDAATKLDLLRQLNTGLSERDIPFLERLLLEKSKKLKDEAINLLRKIPSSPLVQQYWQVLQKNLSLKKERGLLGLKTRSTLHISTPVEPETTLFQSGIEKLSNNKEFTDDEFIVYQLLQWTPLAFFEEYWSLTTEELIRLFQDDAAGKRLFPALVLSVVNFSDRGRALSLMQYSRTFYLDLIPLLPAQQQDYYSIKFFQESPDSIIQYASQQEQEWGRELVTAVLQHAAKNPYQYNRAFFNRTIHLIPVSVAADLNQPALSDSFPGNNWGGTRNALARLLYLKQQTINAFNK